MRAGVNLVAGLSPILVWTLVFLVQAIAIALLYWWLRRRGPDEHDEL